MLMCTCWTCDEELPYTEFYGSNRGRSGPHICKTCLKKKCVERKHGISYDQIGAMYEAQDHRCAICNRPLLLGPAPDMKKARSDYACVDHNHITSKIRALLCFHCNMGLGFFKEVPEFMEKAAAYIRYHK